MSGVLRPPFFRPEGLHKPIKTAYPHPFAKQLPINIYFDAAFARVGPEAWSLAL